MGGSSGGKSKKSSPPPQAQQLDMNAIMGAASAGATAQIKEQYKQLIENYPKLENLTFGTVDRLSKGLANKETTDAQGYIRKAMALGDADPAMADPTEIEQGLYDAGLRDMRLGRALSPEQMREATQSARGAFAARGLATSNAGTAAELLNRDSYANTRERERQAFASSANNQYVNGIGNRRISLANLYMGGAGNLIAADPYSRAVGPGFGLGQQTQSSQMSQIGNTFSSANSLAGDVAGFNANMLDSRANTYANNQAALAGARMQSQAMNQAGWMGLAGAGLGAAGLMLSDRREKKNVRKLAEGGVLGVPVYRYDYKHGAKGKVGVMAQDVAKVLPEAVAEVSVRGKKRLAIRPQMIGQAVAEALAA
jgi:hypothetical protein